jgi:hypothetical protein
MNVLMPPTATATFTRSMCSVKMGRDQKQLRANL